MKEGPLLCNDRKGLYFVMTEGALLSNDRRAIIVQWQKGVYCAMTKGLFYAMTESKNTTESIYKHLMEIYDLVQRIFAVFVYDTLPPSPYRSFFQVGI